MEIQAIYTNIQEILNNYNQLEILSQIKKLKFIILSETYLTKAINEEETQLIANNQFIMLSNSTRTGGIITYFKKSWNVKEISEKIIDSIELDCYLYGEA